MECPHGRLGPSASQVKRMYKTQLRQAKRLRSMRRSSKATFTPEEGMLIYRVIPILHKATQLGDIERSDHYTLYLRYMEAFNDKLSHRFSQTSKEK